MSKNGRARRKRYNTSMKGRAKSKRWNTSPKGRAAAERYRNNSKGREIEARRIRIGGRRVGSVRTVEEARMINEYIKGRVHAFIKGQQTRAQAEGISAGAISAQAKS